MLRKLLKRALGVGKDDKGEDQIVAGIRIPATLGLGTHVVRGSTLVEADDVFWARSSGDLPQMVAALDKPTNPIDRHYLLLAIVEQCYSRRKEPACRATLRAVAALHVQELEHLRTPLIQQSEAHGLPDGFVPLVRTFQRLATVLAEDGNFDAAVQVCERAMADGWQDGTVGGFEGRIARIRKQQAKSAAGKL